MSAGRSHEKAINEAQKKRKASWEALEEKDYV